MRSLISATAALALTIVLSPVVSAADITGCEAASDFGVPWTTTLHGDVDGDHVIDTVRTKAVWLAGGECRAWLIVETADGRSQTLVAPGATPLLKPPGLAGLIRLRPGHRLQIAVVVWLGASTGFLDVYALGHDGLHRLHAVEFPYGGSVVHPSAVDCAHRHGASLVSSTARYSMSDRRYHVERTFWAARGGSLSMVPRLTERVRVRLRDLYRLPEFAGGGLPFPSCTTVRGTA